MNTRDEAHICEALELAREAHRKGNGAYGALLVRDGQVVVRAENTVRTDSDATRHAEMNLLVRAQQQLGREALHECTLVSSTEPCAMCAGAIFWAGVPRVVFGCFVERQTEILGGGLGLGCRQVIASGDRAVEIVGPLLEDEAAAVLRKARAQRG